MKITLPPGFEKFQQAYEQGYKAGYLEATLDYHVEAERELLQKPDPYEVWLTEDGINPYITTANNTLTMSDWSWWPSTPPTKEEK